MASEDELNEALLDDGITSDVHKKRSFKHNLAKGITVARVTFDIMIF